MKSICRPAHQSTTNIAGKCCRSRPAAISSSHFLLSPSLIVCPYAFRNDEERRKQEAALRAQMRQAQDEQMKFVARGLKYMSRAQA